MIKSAHSSTRRGRDRESGQAMVEFALILWPLLMLVMGIIWFGIGINFWLDLNRLANQGARSAAVNCGSATVAANACEPTLAEYLGNQTLSNGNTPEVVICYEEMTGPANSAAVGDPVTVRLTLPDFSLVPFLGNDVLGVPIPAIRVDLVGEATMRLEQVPSSPRLPAYTDFLNNKCDDPTP